RSRRGEDEGSSRGARVVRGATLVEPGLAGARTEPPSPATQQFPDGEQQHGTPTRATAHPPPRPAGGSASLGRGARRAGGRPVLVLTYLLRDVVGVRGQSVAGVVCFLGLGFLFSANLRAINWRTVGWGMALQAAIALFIMVQFSWGDYLISGRFLFVAIGQGF